MRLLKYPLWTGQVLLGVLVPKVGNHWTIGPIFRLDLSNPLKVVISTNVILQISSVFSSAPPPPSYPRPIRPPVRPTGNLSLAMARAEPNGEGEYRG